MSRSMPRIRPCANCGEMFNSHNRGYTVCDSCGNRNSLRVTNRTERYLPICKRDGCGNTTRWFKNGTAKSYCSAKCNSAALHAASPQKGASRCRCESHSGTESWHGSSSGRTYHNCTCDLCRLECNRRSNHRYHSDPGYAAKVNAASMARHNATYVPKPRVLSKWSFLGSDGKRYSGHVGRRRKGWESQNGVCNLCHLELAWVGSCLDHDHNCCPKIKESCGNCDRGVIHNHCNAILGFARDDIKLLRQAIDYLEVA